jgi:hypothetical protein
MLKSSNCKERRRQGKVSGHVGDQLPQGCVTLRCQAPHWLAPRYFVRFICSPEQPTVLVCGHMRNPQL